jgi:hypothetical protein
MTKRWVLLAVGLILSLPWVGKVWAQSEFYNLDNLRPGMKGIGKTCYLGSKPEEFQVEILGVMRRMNPGSDAVLARLSGGPLAETGVFEGMSGSPVFIDGKLLGAVAFSFPFAKEAIAGITPIAQMIDAFTEGIDPGGSRIILKKSLLWNYRLPAADGSVRSSEVKLTDAEARLQPMLAPFAGHALLPIATPLSVGGFSAGTLRMFAPRFRDFGLSVLQGSGTASLQAKASAASSPVQDNASIEPGSNLVVSLVHGDLDVSAGGTVTYVDGKKLYAFGHPLFGLGFSELPMYKGRVLTVFPSLQSSFKILETTDPIGALRQDRSLGVYGILGERPKMIPVRIRTSTSRGVRKTWNFEVANDRLLTPLLLNLTIYETINSTERTMGISTLKVKGKISVKGEEPIEIENTFSSSSGSSVDAALSVAAPVNFLLASGYKNLQFEDIDLEVSALEEDRSAALDSIRLDRSEVRVGDPFNLDIFYQKTDGEIVRETYPLKVPPGITPGPLSLLVADGTTVMQTDAREQGEDLIPKDLSQVIKFINNLRKNNHLYLRMFRQEAGAVINGEGLPGLPPSILSILKSERNSGSMSPLQTLPLMEFELPPSEYVVVGARFLNLVIKP